jgi:hypothetical protein
MKASQALRAEAVHFQERAMELSCRRMEASLVR